MGYEILTGSWEPLFLSVVVVVVVLNVYDLASPLVNNSFEIKDLTGLFYVILPIWKEVSHTQCAFKKHFK